MDPNLVWNKEERAARCPGGSGNKQGRRRKKKTKTLDESGDDSSASTPPPPLSPTSPLVVSTPTETDFGLSLWSLPPIIESGSEDSSLAVEYMSDLYDEQYRSISFGHTLIREILMCSAFGIQLTPEASLKSYR